MNEHSQESRPLLTLGENIKVIAVTGGPCGGKTTGLARLRTMLEDRDYKVLVVPESATKLFTAGLNPALCWLRAQEEILLDTIEQENRFFSIARRYRDNGHKVVILCDRGTMDGWAYLRDEDLQKQNDLLARRGLTMADICEGRYHAVMHLRTAARGAEAFYTLANNNARTETPEMARDLDERTLAAWSGHPHVRVIDNSTDFESKINRLAREVFAVLGDPLPLEIERKYTVEQFNPECLKISWVRSSIFQDYLVSTCADEERRVRQRSDVRGTSYYYTVKRPVGPGVRVEEERMITAREYETLLTMRDPNRQTVAKDRVCFFWGEQFFEVDTFHGAHKGLVVMEIELSDNAQTVELPPFITVKADVTGDKHFSNSELARRKMA